MSLLARTGRRSMRHRLIIGVIYSILVLGGITMIYPLLIMIGGSANSGIDSADASVLPSFLIDSNALYAKHIEGFFNEDLEAYCAACNVDASSFSLVKPPVENSGETRLLPIWEDFLASHELPFYASSPSYVSVTLSRGTEPTGLRAFKEQLRQNISDSLPVLNQKLDSQFLEWRLVTYPLRDYRVQRSAIRDDPFDQAATAYHEKLPAEERYFYSLEGFYKNTYLKNQYTKDIGAYNAAHGTQYRSWDEVHLSRKASGNAKEQQDWETFVRSVINPLWLRIDASAAAECRSYMRAKYGGEIQKLNSREGKHYSGFDEIAIPDEVPHAGAEWTDWVDYIQGWAEPVSGKRYVLSLDSVRIQSVDFMFQDYLQSRFGSIGRLNETLNAQFSSFADIFPPQVQWHYQSFLKQTAALKWEFLTRNYRAVIDFMVLRGRGFLNTAIFCTLSILAALIVNPLAAYALSRYKPPNTYGILLLLMLTMAFPPMVTQIPSFILLRNFNLLNTFAALVLPGLANGYSIFLLKGFFDSLPKELYESASLDGAGEFRIFWQITMSLSTPILAVIALNAFVYAYSSFMFALLICQKEDMWTMTVWLYQLQSSSGSGVVYSSLVIAAIPTFIVFALCQNVIMRGIVVPVEK